MAFRFWPFWVHGQNVVVVSGAFMPNGNGPIDQTKNVSGTGVGAMAGFTAARSNTGIYTVTFSEPFPELIVLQPGLVNAVANRIEALTPPGSLRSFNGGRDLQVRTSDAAGAPADVAAAAGRFITFIAELRRRAS